MTMIDDPELRALFKAESEEHLQMLEDGLLRLEADPQDISMLEELFRSAHSLKGAAGMLGVDSVETLAHHFEDVLGATRRGHLTMSSATADRLYHGLDAMRRLAREAGNGEPADVDVPTVLARLRGEETETKLGPENDPPAAFEPQAPEQAQASDLTARQGILAAPASLTEFKEPSMCDVSTAASEPPALDALAAPTEPAAFDSPTAFKIETIRVDPLKLDALMTLAGEMTVTTTRVERALTVIDDLVTLWEEWGREAAALSALPAALSAGLAESSGAAVGKQLTRFHAREIGRVERMGHLLRRLKRTNDAEMTRLRLVAGELDEAIRGMRLLPFSTLFNLFPRLVRDLSHEQGKEVRLVLEGGSVTADKHLLEELKDPLMHMLRNAVDHGIERPEDRERQGKLREATLRLRAAQVGANVVVDLVDDGRGLDEEAIRRSALQKRLRSAHEIAMLSSAEVQMLIFVPGFSTSTRITDVSGRGVGLDVVRTNIERFKGTISVKSEVGRGCTFRLQVPMTLATTRVLLVQSAQQVVALPIDAVQEIFLLSPQEDVFSIEGRPAIQRDSRPVAVARLADLLEFPSDHSSAASERKANGGRTAQENALRPCILLSVGAERLGLFVDDLLDEQEVILKPFGGLLQRVRNVLGATILSTGDICIVLNPMDLILSARKSHVVPGETAPAAEADRKKVVLLADDSITTRTQERRILESAGYEVITAVDGADAFQKLASRAFDAVISDVEMPNMDGFALAAHIRQDAQYKELPIILVTSLASDTDRQRGVEAGANAYITKGAFDQKELLNTLRRLV